MKYVRVVCLMMVALGAAIPLEAATATWDRNPESSVTGYRLSYGTQSGVHPTSINVGNVVSYQFFPPAGALYYVVVQAYTATGALSPKSAEVVLDLRTTQPPPTQNQPPTFTQPANQSSVQNTAVSLALQASDPQGTAVRYAASGLPPGLTVNATSGVISGTVTTVGSYNVTATASDGSLSTARTFTWTVTPSSGATTTVLLTPVDTTIDIYGVNYVNRPDLLATTYPANRVGQAILMKFNVSQIPSNAVIQSASLELSLIGVDGDTADPNYSVSLHQIINRNSDPARATGMTADGTTNWTANTCCYQNMPMAQADISPARAVTIVNRTLGVKTWDARQLVQAWTSNPASNFGLLLNGDVSKGINRYRSFASMQHATASARPVLRVVYGGSSSTPTDTTAPTVSLTAPALNATVSGASVTVSANASDAVGVAGVQFKVDGNNIGAEDTTAPYSIVWNTTGAANGTHQLTAVARDAAGNTTTSAARAVTVSNTTTTNLAPVLTQPPNQTSAIGAAASLQLSASDPNGTAVTYSASGLPPGLAVNSTSGRISGTPTTVGTYSVTARASDGALTASRTFSWTVTSSTSGTYTVNLSPLDTTIEYTTTNYSTSPRLTTHTYPANSVRKAIVMKFDLSQIPANATIQSATLQLYLVGVDVHTTDPNYAVSLHRILNVNPNPSVATGFIAATNRPWTANNCCAHKAPLAQADISSAQAVTTINRTLGAKTWNALSVVQAWRNSPATNFGLLLNADRTRAADRFRDFASMEDATPSRRPFLRITYTTGAQQSTMLAATTAEASTATSVAAGTMSRASEPATQDTSVERASTPQASESPDSNDVPVDGDFDGDGRSDPATYRPATGEWRVWPSSRNYVLATPIVWGAGADLPVPADYDGDRLTDIAVYRPSTGTWHILLSSTRMQSSREIQWGEATDRPVPIDYDRDGRADLALPRSGGFEILLSSSNYEDSIHVK